MKWKWQYQKVITRRKEESLYYIAIIVKLLMQRISMNWVLIDPHIYAPHVPTSFKYVQCHDVATCLPLLVYFYMKLTISINFNTSAISGSFAALKDWMRTFHVGG